MAIHHNPAVECHTCFIHPHPTSPEGETQLGKDSSLRERAHKHIPWMGQKGHCHVKSPVIEKCPVPRIDGLRYGAQTAFPAAQSTGVYGCDYL